MDAAVEAEVATSAPTALADRKISQLEAEIAALRFSSWFFLRSRFPFFPWWPWRRLWSRQRFFCPSSIPAADSC